MSKQVPPQQSDDELYQLSTIELVKIIKTLQAEIILFLYTFGENLEILAYLFWPGFLVMGMAFKPQR